MEDDLINKLVSTFKEKMEAIKEKLDDVQNFKVQEYYIKNKVENGYNSVYAVLDFRDFELDIIYKINASMLIPKSMLEIRFMFKGGRLPVEYSIYDILEIIDKDNFKCYTLPYIDSEEKMNNSIDYLFNTFMEYKKNIELIAVDEEKLNELETGITKNIVISLKENVFNSRNVIYLTKMLEFYYLIDASRYTQNSYEYILTGKYDKAIKKYSKNENRLTQYEKRLLEHIKQGGKIENILPDNLRTLEQARKLKNSGLRQLVAMYISWILLTPVWTLVYSLLFVIAKEIITKGAIYVGGQYIFVLLLPAFLTSIANSYFIRRWTYKLVFRKKYKEILALDTIENTKVSLNFMTKFFQFVIAASIVFTLLLSNSYISFYGAGFKQNLDMLSLKGRYIEYSEVDKVYKTRAIINNFGKRIDNPTYIILLKDGDQIDLYFYIGIEEIERNIVPIFKEKNIKIIEIDTDKDIQKDLEKNNQDV